LEDIKYYFSPNSNLLVVTNDSGAYLFDLKNEEINLENKEKQILEEVMVV